MPIDDGAHLSTSNARPPAPALDRKVAFLSCPSAYGADGVDVRAIETHMSWVFLAGQSAFKLKKPVHFPYLDLSTLTAREANCRAELALNRRLAPDVYLRVSALTLSADSRLMVEGAGEIVDWLVVMRRLPRDLMLDALIARGALEAAHIESLAATLAGFYCRPQRPRVSPSEYFRRLTAEQVGNREVLTLRRFTCCDLAATLLDRMNAALVGARSQLESRAAGGHLVDGHGDLRPEHVCFEKSVVIFDCLEFSETLRQVDPVDEVAGFGMECARLGVDWFGTQVLERVVRLTGQSNLGCLPYLHSARRALLRARLTLAHLLDPAPREPERWQPLAEQYLALAAQALEKAERS